MQIVVPLVLILALQISIERVIIPSNINSGMVSLMKTVHTFITKNKLITSFFIMSILIILSYLVTMDWPELFVDAEKWYNLLFQLAVGYIINFMFYVTQVYIPNSRRDTKVQECISNRISQLIRDMDASLSQLVHLYAKEHKGDKYTEDELKLLLNLQFSDNVNVINASKTTIDNFVYFTVREWLIKCISDTEKNIDNLFKYYASDISVDLMKILEEIPRSTYHSIMKIFLSSSNEVNFRDSDSNFFAEYYELIQKLEKIKKQDYS